jgi:hypothetical protein
VTKIVLEIPDELKVLEKPLRAVCDLVAGQVERGKHGARVEYTRFCGELQEAAQTVELAAHECALAALDVDAPALTIDGELYRKVGRNPGVYHAKPGSVSVPRSIYRKAGDRQARTVDTISLRVGAVGDGWLPDTAEAMAFLLQQGTSREAEATGRRIGRLRYSRSSFEDVGHEVGRQFVASHQGIEEALIQRYDVPREAKSVSVSLDRVSVPMEEPRPRPPGRPKKNAPKRPIAVVYHMAFCGTVTLHDVEGNALHTIRYGTMPDGDPDGLCMGMAADVLALLDKAPRLKIELLCDGAPEMWNRLDAEFTGSKFGNIHRLIDFYHLIEKLSAAAAVLCRSVEEKKATVERWKVRLKNTDRAARSILATLRDSGLAEVRVGDQRPVHEAITYLENNGHRMHYASAIASGKPIGSGAVEATCKSLVGHRMKRSGARWKTNTGEDVIHLRALALSDRWEDAMALTLPSPPVRIRRAA